VLDDRSNDSGFGRYPHGCPHCQLLACTNQQQLFWCLVRGAFCINTTQATYANTPASGLQQPLYPIASNGVSCRQILDVYLSPLNKNRYPAYSILPQVPMSSPVLPPQVLSLVSHSRTNRYCFKGHSLQPCYAFDFTQPFVDFLSAVLLV